ncbi:MAG: GxxExxY protein, partial [Spirochaetaceae bacterium]|nr:GxxExxY protein [Spirochaetaceae bacterium]
MIIIQFKCPTKIFSKKSFIRKSGLIPRSSASDRPLIGYRIDMMVEHGQLLIENKVVKEFTDVHPAQMLTYLKLSG